MSRNNKKNGFTLIELTLAMSFVAILLILITITVIQISGIYNKGLLLKAGNQIGRSLVDELQRDIAGSPSFDLSNTFLADNRRLCTGQYSYIWNYGSDLNDTKHDKNKYKDNDDIIRFVKIYDPSNLYCYTDNEDRLEDINYVDAVELLGSTSGGGQYNLVMHNFSITSGDKISDNKTGQQLYNIEFLLGTNDKATLNQDYTKCKTPNEDGSDLTYCSVIQFNITVRAGNLTE